jgi:hypothetical protein
MKDYFTDACAAENHAIDQKEKSFRAELLAKAEKEKM